MQCEEQIIQLFVLPQGDQIWLICHSIALKNEQYLAINI